MSERTHGFVMGYIMAIITLVMGFGIGLAW